MESMDNNTLFRNCKPILVLMKLFGLYHSKHPSDFMRSEKLQLIGNKWDQTISQLYSKFISAVLFLNALRYLLSFTTKETFGFEMLTKVQFSTLCGMSFYNSITFYQACANPSRLYFFFISWRKIKLEFPMKCQEKHKCYIKLVARTGCLLLVFFTITNCLFLGYVLFETDAYDLMLTPYTMMYKDNLHSPLHTVLRILFLIVNSFMCAGLTLPLFLLGCFCK